MKKAYQISCKKSNKPGEWGIYSGENAAKAKTIFMVDLKENYPESNYSWITTCRRIPEYDELANKYSGCIAWKMQCWDRDIWERWEQDKGHWYE